ncbi:C40 family peptidase [Pantoea agglomerans]|uniref:C40 family peptidase n=1 Tax=Enterobacter agglomerans TaxID=549 RepID=UPI0024131DCA|nr:C40 family peptidase [Pantoea agglomerans]
MITEDLKAAILHHAKEAYPRECCGVVIMPAGRPVQYLPCRNIAEEPESDFAIHPEDYAAAEEMGQIIAVAHSHPDASTRPGETDRALCDLSGLAWYIVSWPEGDFRVLLPRGELPLVGRPFVLGVYDCWGLIMSWYRQSLGIELPDHRVNYAWWEQGENLYMDNWYSTGFREFSGPARAGDVVLMRVGSRVVNHAGVLLEDGMLLHHLYGHLSQRVVYDDNWRSRTEIIVRYHGIF